MERIAVIYKSRYGFTQRYAQWISEDLGADLLEARRVKPADLMDYDIILYGGGLYAGGVNGLPLITKNFASICDKAVYLFTVGAADVTDPYNVGHIREGLSRVMTPEMMEKIGIYHFRGGINYSDMSFVHRSMMGMLMKMMRRKPESELRSEDRVMMESYGRNVDFTDRTMITPLVEMVRRRQR